MKGLALLVGLYVLMSLITYAVYMFDKGRAEDNAARGLEGSDAGRRRVAERKLHTLELLGGWPGGLVAQRRLWHKVHSLKYQPVFWFIVGLHAGTVGWVVSHDRVDHVDRLIQSAAGDLWSLAVTLREGTTARQP